MDFIKPLVQEPPSYRRHSHIHGDDGPPAAVPGHQPGVHVPGGGLAVPRPRVRPQEPRGGRAGGRGARIQQVLQLPQLQHRPGGLGTTLLGLQPARTPQHQER